MTGPAWAGGARSPALGCVWPSPCGDARRCRAGPAKIVQAAIVDRGADGDVCRFVAGAASTAPSSSASRSTREGEPGAVDRGRGQGSVVTVTAPDVIVRGLTITGLRQRPRERWIPASSSSRPPPGGGRGQPHRGQSVRHLSCTARADAIVRGNVIVGLAANAAQRGRQRRLAMERARGARSSTTTSAIGRDGIFMITSRKNVFSGNRFRDLRFAIHYMYTNDSEVTRQRLGRQPRRLRHHVFEPADGPRQHLAIGDRDHGLAVQLRQLLRDHGNVGEQASAERSVGKAGRPRMRAMSTACQRRDARRSPAETVPRSGPEKCVFIYNTNKNRFRDNWFEGCDIGVHFTAGSEGNEIAGNAFVGNRNQVKYVGTRYLDWSQGRSRQLLERQPGLRPQRRRHRRHGLPAQRPRRPGAVDGAAAPRC